MSKSKEEIKQLVRKLFEIVENDEDSFDHEGNASVIANEVKIAFENATIEILKEKQLAEERMIMNSWSWDMWSM
jgi:hypothetical protein